MGFTNAIVPSNSPAEADGITVVRVGTVTEALAAVGLADRPKLVSA
jgi:predicted ATP-dependent serine protease